MHIENDHGQHLLWLGRAGIQIPASSDSLKTASKFPVSPSVSRIGAVSQGKKKETDPTARNTNTKDTLPQTGGI